ncbi:MAG: hypothetical protein ACJAYH_001679 [Celeribacter sp.]|jgi:hypothetical protein
MSPRPFVRDIPQRQIVPIFDPLHEGAIEFEISPAFLS